MNHPSANFLIQRLIFLARWPQTEMILESIKRDFGFTANNAHGTRALQCLLDELGRHQSKKMSEKSSQLLAQGLNTCVLELACNVRGNHVIKKCLNLMTNETHKQEVYEAVLGMNPNPQFLQISKDQHGCQVIQECIRTASLKNKLKLMQPVKHYLTELINDEFGNYVVQGILEPNGHNVKWKKQKEAQQWLKST